MRHPIQHEVSSGMRLLAVMFFMIASVHPAWASGTDTDAFQHRYITLKINTAAWLNAHQPVRDGHISSRDRTALLDLRREVLNFCFDVKKHIHTQETTPSAKTVAASERLQLLGLAYSCDAMEQMLEVEFDAQRPGANREMLRQIQAKYQELWELADQATTTPPSSTSHVTTTTYPMSGRP